MPIEEAPDVIEEFPIPTAQEFHARMEQDLLRVAIEAASLGKFEEAGRLLAQYAWRPKEEDNYRSSTPPHTNPEVQEIQEALWDADWIAEASQADLEHEEMTTATYVRPSVDILELTTGLDLTLPEDRAEFQRRVDRAKAEVPAPKQCSPTTLNTLTNPLPQPITVADELSEGLLKALVEGAP